MRRWILIVALAAFATAPRPAAALLLDEFDDPTEGQAVLLQNAATGNGTNTALGLDAVGGSRQIDVVIQDTLPGGSSVLAEVNGLTSTGTYQLSNSVTQDSLARITYNANGAGLNFDLGSSTLLRLEGVLNDLFTSYIFALETFGGGSASCSAFTGAGFSGDVSCDFAGLFNGLAANNVDQITVIIETPRGGDVLIERFVLVPEPAGMFLLALGSGGLAWLARRQRS